MKKILLLIIFITSSSALKAQLSADEALAIQHFRSGDFEKAALLYEKLFERTKNISYYDPYFSSLLQIKKLDEAEKLTRSLLKSQPDNYNYPVDLGRIYQERGEQEKLIALYNGLIRAKHYNKPKLCWVISWRVMTITIFLKPHYYVACRKTLRISL